MIKAKVSRGYSVQLALAESGHTSYLWTHLILTAALQGVIIIIPILQLRTRRHRKLSHLPRAPQQEVGNLGLADRQPNRWVG